MDKIKQAVKENAERLGLLLLEFSVQGEKIEAVLAKAGSNISIGDLETLTHNVSRDLEKLGFAGQYELVFLSAGLDRVLKSREEIDIFAGKDAKIVYSNDGKTTTEIGKLLGNFGESVKFETDSGVKEIPFNDINKVSLYVKEFSERKGGKK
ncbi:MAG: ribosome maturation factor RimP [Caldisericaceae bacterium]